MTAAARYLRPGRSDAVFNRIVATLTRAGVSVWGSLVAPRGVTQWVRNIRAAGEAELRVGRRVEPIRVAELADDEKPALLRAYLKRWKFEVGVFFDGVDASASDETLRRIAPGYPVFRVLAAK